MNITSTRLTRLAGLAALLAGMCYSLAYSTQ